MNIPDHLDALIKQFSKLPGIGPKSAARLAFHILKISREEAMGLSKAISEVKDVIRSCSICGGISESEICAVCQDPGRENNKICVVADEKDVLTIEKTDSFKGVYHVLRGLISPLDGIGPDELNIKALLERCSSGAITEIIIATNPTVEGDATALYLAGIIKPLGIRVMRIAHGLPVGADLEFADSITIAKSLDARFEL